jgi:MFS family permease
MSELTYALVLPLFLGARHALEPDHLAAMTTLLTTERGRPAALGMWWGAGHALSVFVVACVLSAIEKTLSPAWSDRCELLVAAMLVFLGGKAVLSVFAAFREGQTGLRHTHIHGHEQHHHAGPVGHIHIGCFTLAQKPLFVGLVHGLAGSGALTALLSTKMPTMGLRLAYVGLFGLGAMLGMGALLGLFGWPFTQFLRNRPSVLQGLTLLAGLLSLVIGVTFGLAHVHRLWPGG